MGQPKTHTNGYSASDFERYYSGQMSASEKHALEKAALDDPFLAEALEGYMLARTPAGDLEQLRQRLHERLRKSERSKVIIPSWLRIAATVMILVGTGWLVLHLALPKHEMAQNRSATPLPAKDSSDQMGKPGPYDQVPTTTMRADSYSKQAPAVAASTNKKRPARLPAPGEKEANQGNDVPAGSVTAVSAPAGDHVNPLPVAAPPVTDKEIRADSMSTMARTGPTPAEARTKAQAFSAGKREDGATQLNVTLKRLPDTGSNRPIVLESGKPRQSRYKPLIIIDTIEPQQGWTYYDDYVASNLKTPEELKIKPVSGTVELSFEVDEQGEPVNIRVEKSLCDQCDQEAVRVLKKGPKWKRPNRKKGKIAFRF